MDISSSPIQLISTLATQVKSPVGNEASSLSGAFASMISEIRKSDKTMSKAMTDKVDLHELVTDISLAETNLKILVAIRDSLMNAIQELLRMQI